MSGRSEHERVTTNDRKKCTMTRELESIINVNKGKGNIIHVVISRGNVPAVPIRADSNIHVPLPFSNPCSAEFPSIGVGNQWTQK